MAAIEVLCSVLLVQGFSQARAEAIRHRSGLAAREKRVLSCLTVRSGKTAEFF